MIPYESVVNVMNFSEDLMARIQAQGEVIATLLGLAARYTSDISHIYTESGNTLTQMLSMLFNQFENGEIAVADRLAAYVKDVSEGREIRRQHYVHAVYNPAHEVLRTSAYHPEQTMQLNQIDNNEKVLARDTKGCWVLTRQSSDLYTVRAVPTITTTEYPFRKDGIPGRILQNLSEGLLPRHRRIVLERPNFGTFLVQPAMSVIKPMTRDVSRALTVSSGLLLPRDPPSPSTNTLPSTSVVAVKDTPTAEIRKLRAEELIDPSHLSPAFVRGANHLNISKQPVPYLPHMGGAKRSYTSLAFGSTFCTYTHNWRFFVSDSKKDHAAIGHRNELIEEELCEARDRTTSVSCKILACTICCFCQDRLCTKHQETLDRKKRREEEHKARRAAEALQLASK